MPDAMTLRFDNDPNQFVIVIDTLVEYANKKKWRTKFISNNIINTIPWMTEDGRCKTNENKNNAKKYLFRKWRNTIGSYPSEKESRAHNWSHARCSLLCTNYRTTTRWMRLWIEWWVMNLDVSLWFLRSKNILNEFDAHVFRQILPIWRQTPNRFLSCSEASSRHSSADESSLFTYIYASRRVTFRLRFANVSVPLVRLEFCFEFFRRMLRVCARAQPLTES